MKHLFSQTLLKRSTALALLAGPFFAFSVAAAPQILAVASTDLKIPVSCDGGVCSVELTAICLQEQRSSPIAGTPYYVHGPERFELTGTTGQGQEISLSNLDLTVEAARGHNAIKVAFREVELEKYGRLTVQISVPENVSVVPLPVAHDVNPQTDEDIAAATGPMRQLASTLIDEETRIRDAAELINQTINRLPWRGRATDGERVAALGAYKELTKSVGFSTAARTNADAVVSECYSRTKAGSLSFRQCLGSWHDRLVGRLNNKYWTQLKTGS